MIFLMYYLEIGGMVVLTEMFLVLLGGLLAIAGGAIQSYITTKNDAKQKRNESREKAYLGYIDALLKIRVDNQYGTVKTKEFWESFHGIQANLRLYGSKSINNKAQNFEEHLYDCWKYDIDVGNTEELKINLIVSMRKELHID